MNNLGIIGLNLSNQGSKYKLMTTRRQVMGGCNSMDALDAVGGQGTASCHIVHDYAESSLERG